MNTHNELSPEALGIFHIDNVLPLDELVERGFTEDEKNHWLVGRTKVRKTKALFIDLDSTGDRANNYYSIFCLTDARPKHYKEYGPMVRYDLKQLYLACGDITEKVFVDKFLYDLSQWNKIQANSILSPYIADWRKEQRLGVKSKMFQVLLDDSLDPSSKTRTSSARYLLEKYYDPERKSGKQAPKDKSEDNHDLLLMNEDYSRLKEYTSKVN